jgi:hypothetical protein
LPHQTVTLDYGASAHACPIDDARPMTTKNIGTLSIRGETALVTAALYAGSTHRIGVLPVVIVAATAAVVGDNIGYLIGRSIGLRLIVRYGRYVRLNEARLLFCAPSPLFWPGPITCAGPIS